MESLWKLTYLLTPSSLALILTAISVVFVSASRSLSHSKEMERNLDFSESSITLDRSQALMIPLASSFSLLIMFYLFSSLSVLVTAFTTAASAAAVYFSIAPFLPHPRRRLLLSLLIVATWLVSGHWILNNALGVAICVAFVSHVRLPNVKICAILLSCLFFYDIFWVFFSERFFGANVMVSVATQKAANPVRTVADRVGLPGVGMIVRKLEMPVKLVFPKDIFGGNVAGSNVDYMMLGLGDMAIPGMLLALVLCFDHRKKRDTSSITDTTAKGPNYVWYALVGYAAGLITALAAGILSQSPQPALLYLVPSTLGPVIFLSWIRKELHELWDGSSPPPNDKIHLVEV